MNGDFPLHGAVQCVKEMVKMTADAGLEIAGFINGPKLWKKDDMRRYADLLAGTREYPYVWRIRGLPGIMTSRCTSGILAGDIQLAKDAIPDVVELSNNPESVLWWNCIRAPDASALAAVNLFEGVDPGMWGHLRSGQHGFGSSMRPRCEVKYGSLPGVLHAKKSCFLHR